jgi:hypothetical protein
MTTDLLRGQVTAITAIESRLAAAGFASIEVHVTISDGRPRRTLPLDDADKKPEPMVRC